jgi:aerobic carbon-monoxide dehydrogenase medium subunit
VISKEIEFHAPREIDGVLALLAQHGADATLLAGGMSLMPAMNLGLAQPAIVVSLNHLSGLDHVVEDDGTLRLGALVRHEQVRTDPLIRRYCPFLSEAATVIGDAQVRHRGTLGGSIAHADPAADYLPVLAAADARVTLRSAQGERTVAASDFFVDLMTTARQPSELVVEVVVPKVGAPLGTAYLRLARVEGSFAIVNAAAIVEPGAGGGRVAIGGVGPRPVLVDAGPYLQNGLTDTALDQIGEAVYAASADAYGDISADPEYRQAMARVYARRAVGAAAARLAS